MIFSIGLLSLSLYINSSLRGKISPLSDFLFNLYTYTRIIFKNPLFSVKKLLKIKEKYVKIISYAVFNINLHKFYFKGVINNEISGCSV